MVSFKPLDLIITVLVCGGIISMLSLGYAQWQENYNFGDLEQNTTVYQKINETNTLTIQIKEKADLARLKNPTALENFLQGAMDSVRLVYNFLELIPAMLTETVSYFNLPPILTPLIYGLLLASIVFAIIAAIFKYAV